VRAAEPDGAGVLRVDPRVVPPGILLEYATPRPRQRWRIGKLPGDAILDLVAAVLSVLVNLAFLDESRNIELIRAECTASIFWGGFLFFCGIALASNSPHAEWMHRFYAWVKLLLASVAVVGAIGWADGDFRVRLILSTLGGATYALLVIYVGVVNTPVEPKPGEGATSA